MEQAMKVESTQTAASGLSAELDRGFDGYWALVRHGNPALADDVFAESLARTAWEAGKLSERDACAEKAQSLGVGLAAVNDDSAMQFAGSVISTAIRNRSNV